MTDRLPVTERVGLLEPDTVVDVLPVADGVLDAEADTVVVALALREAECVVETDGVVDTVRVALIDLVSEGEGVTERVSDDVTLADAVTEVLAVCVSVVVGVLDTDTERDVLRVMEAVIDTDRVAVPVVVIVLLLV